MLSDPAQATPDDARERTGGGLRAALSLRLRYAKTCRTASVACSDGTADAFIRHRPWYADALVLAGNLYLAASRGGVRLLTRKQWLAWEPRAHLALSGLRVQANPRGRLTMPRISGTVLSAILASPEHSLAEQAEALCLALRSLAAAHRVALPWPDGVIRPFSHGDATVRNVICDPTTGRACWIDFETLHDPSRPATWRHADDLRAVAYSAAEFMAESDHPTLCDTIVQAYPDMSVLHELASLLHTHRPSLYHMAQGLLPPRLHRRFTQMLAARLQERRPSEQRPV